MSTNLKEKVLELAEIAKACPDNLQTRCFELLLENFLASRSSIPHTKPSRSGASANEQESATESGNGPATVTAPNSQEDFSEKDLHVKMRRFLKDQNLTLDHLNQLFYKEGDAAKPLFEDLRSTKLAESQIRIALLQALKNALSSGEFEFDGEEVRREVQLRKCYDPTNFTAHFRNNKGLFDGFQKYDKQTPKVKLSSEGRSALAEVIKTLQ